MSVVRYVPYGELHGRPSIIVDGSAAPGTVLTLSHWPGSGSPPDLAADLSTEIVFRYLDRPTFAVDAEAVSNNHFDEDGLCGIFALLHPEQAIERRERLIQIASAGDFSTCSDVDAARAAFTLSAYADPMRSPLELPPAYPAKTAVLYSELLALLPQIADDVGRFRDLWAEEDAALQRDDARIERGEIRIEERPDLDLAIVTLGKDADVRHDGEWDGGCHPMALYARTKMHRVMVLGERRYLVRYRYETWVDYASSPVAPRIDLSPLAARLQEAEGDGARWTFDGVDEIVPSLRLLGGARSSLSPDRFRQAVVGFLQEARA